MISISWNIILSLLVSVIAFDEVNLTQQNNENILCRDCGVEVSSSFDIFLKSSAKSRYSFRDTLFGKDEVLVQVFANDMFFHYPVITFKKSTCVPTGEWEETTSWFPDYLWKPCVCSECGAFVGFVFKPIYSNVDAPNSKFYGLVLTTVISENFLDFITEYPANISN